jgi:hypothetical protein
MRLTLKYLQLTSQGIYRYRRRVPDRLCTLVGRNELVRKLGETEKEALRNYPAVHSRAEKLLLSATKKLKQLHAEGFEPQFPEPQTALMIRRHAERALRDLGFDPTGTGFGLDDGEVEWVHRSVISEGIAEKYPEDPETGYPIGVAPTDTEIVRMLHSSRPPDAPPPTFDDAARLYVEEKIQGQISARQNINRVIRVSKIVQSALGRDPVLTGLKKKDAREVRDHMLSTRASVRHTDASRRRGQHEPSRWSAVHWQPRRTRSKTARPPLHCSRDTPSPEGAIEPLQLS